MLFAQKKAEYGIFHKENAVFFVLSPNVWKNCVFGERQGGGAPCAPGLGGGLHPLRPRGGVFEKTPLDPKNL